MRVRRGGFFHQSEWRGRRRRWLAVLGGLLGALAQPADATSFRGHRTDPGGSRPDLLLQSELGSGLQDRSGLRGFRQGDEALRITSALLPGEGSTLSPYQRLQRSLHRRFPGAGLTLPTGPGPVPGATSVPEPATLALVFAGLAAAGAWARRRAHR